MKLCGWTCEEGKIVKQDELRLLGRYVKGQYLTYKRRHRTQKFPEVFMVYIVWAFLLDDKAKPMGLKVIFHPICRKFIIIYVSYNIII